MVSIGAADTLPKDLSPGEYNGWPLASAGPIATSVIRAPRPAAEARTDRLVSRVYAATAGMTASISSLFEASPLGRTAAVPWLLGPVHEGAWACVMVELSGLGPWGGSAPGLPTAASFDAEMQGNEVTVTWPDGFRTVTGFTRSRPTPS